MSTLELLGLVAAMTVGVVIGVLCTWGRTAGLRRQRNHYRDWYREACDREAKYRHEVTRLTWDTGEQRRREVAHVIDVASEHGILAGLRAYRKLSREG